MSGERFKEQEKGSFFGDFLYNRVVPEDHFLRQLEAIIPWQRFTKRLVRLYRGKARQGRPPYDPAGTSFRAQRRELRMEEQGMGTDPNE